MNRCTLRRGGAARAHRPPRSVLILPTLFLVCMNAFAARAVVPVEALGVYSNVAADARGFPYGFEVSLWRAGSGAIGILTYSAGAHGFAHTSMLRDIEINDRTGAVSFRARVSLDSRRTQSGYWGPTVESISFAGTLSDIDLTGDFELTSKEEGEPERFEHHRVVLVRHAADADVAYRDYATWLAANEGRIGMREIVGAAPGADQPTRSFHVGLAGGIVNAQGDGARYFNSEGIHVAIDALYTVASRLSVGARVGLARWSPNVDRIAPDVAPAGVNLYQIDVPETGYVVEFFPIVRLSSADARRARVVAFAQASAGVAVVNMESPYSIAWEEGARLEGLAGSVGNKGTYAGAALGAGVSLRISEFSRLDVYPEYHSILAGDESMSFVGVSVHFRVEFLHG